jgi:hypothetical protein
MASSVFPVRVTECNEAVTDLPGPFPFFRASIFAAQKECHAIPSGQRVFLCDMSIDESHPEAYRYLVSQQILALLHLSDTRNPNSVDTCSFERYELRVQESHEGHLQYFWENFER